MYLIFHFKMSLKLTRWCSNCNAQKMINVPVKRFFEKNSNYIGTFYDQIDIFIYTCEDCQWSCFLSIADEKLDQKTQQFVICCFKNMNPFWYFRLFGIMSVKYFASNVDLILKKKNRNRILDVYISTRKYHAHIAFDGPLFAINNSQ